MAVGARHLYVALDEGAAAGSQGQALYASSDGGHSWRRQSLAGVALCACDVSAPRFFTASDGALYLMGFTMNGSGKPLVRVYWTSDGGRQWRASGPNAGRATAVSLADSRTAWIAASAPGRIRGPFDRLFRTSDAGRHWQTLKLPFDADGYQLDAVSATVAYAFRAVNGGSSILRTEDGGRSWQTIRTVAAKT